MILARRSLELPAHRPDDHGYLYHGYLYNVRMMFNDHFSNQADEYARRRPHYPGALFEYLASIAPERRSAWDCGTGNGQAALGIAPYFDRVMATDPSAQQLRNAFRHENVHYVLCRAEEPPLANGSVDLVTVAQAVHWFDVPRFFEQAKRVLRRRGICAVWCYTHTQISPSVDAVVYDFYYNVVGPYWPRERVLVDDGYRSLAFPFEEIEPPAFAIQLEWSLDDLFGYLSTWSPVRRYIAANGSDPMELVRAPLVEAWGDLSESRPVALPISMRAGRNL
jgi:SAM-dependent methyltransferase